MPEIEMTLPTVAYGNVKVRLTPEEMGADASDAAAIGAATAVYLNLFTQGWKQGAALDVTAEVHMDQSRVEAPHPTDAEAIAELKAQLGATVVDEEDALPSDTVPDDEPEDGESEAPWEKTSPVAPKAKPWENGGSSKPAKVAEIDW